MLRLGVLFLLLFGGGSSIAQNEAWHPIPDSLPSLYRSGVFAPASSSLVDFEATPVLGIEVDSVGEVNNVTSIYPTPVLRDTSADPGNEICIDTAAGGIIGERVLQLDSGSYCFFNKDKDSIFLKTQLDIGERWPVYHYPSGDTLYGEVLSLEYDSVLAGMDSIKTIGLERVDGASGTVVTGIPIDTMEFRIAKEEGLIALPSIYRFPENQELFRLFRRGLVTRGELYDMEVGARFHYYESTIDYYDWSYLSESYSKVRILGKDVFPGQDSLHYRLRVAGSGSVDTIGRGYGRLSKPFRDALPHEAMMEDLSSSSSPYPSYYSMGWDFCDQHLSIELNFPAIRTLDSCYLSFEPMPSGKRYAEGLGKTGSYNWTSPSVEEKKELVYHKVGAQACGDSVNLATEDHSSMDEEAFQVAPNPFQKKVRVQYPSGTRAIELFDLQGRRLGHWKVPNRKQEGMLRIDGSELSPGTYLLLIRNEDELFRRKLLKE